MKFKTARVNKSAQEELEALSKESGGFLRPEKVVRYAENPDTALHKYFEWDDTAAAHQYRLKQARDIIRVLVIVDEKSLETTRAYVSLRDDRCSDVGYRAIASVLSDKELTQMLLNDAFYDLERFEKKYRTLKNIAVMNGLFSQINTVKQLKQKGNTK